VADATGTSTSARRRLTRWSAIASLLLATAALAACGDSGTGSSTGSAGSATSANTGATADTGGVTGKQVTDILKIGPANAGKGKTFELGAALALSGPGSFYGKVMKEGIDLATAQIKAAGGPDIHVTYKDHKSGNAQAGSRLTRELGIAKTPAVLASYVGDIGSMFPGVAQYKMLALDGGGGTSDFGQGKPYFWGMRAIEPDDDFVGALKYWKATKPDVKKVSLVYIDQGPINKIVEANFKKAVAAEGLQFASAETTAIGSTDYSSTIAKLKTANPDAVFTFLIGVDAGYFMKQFVNAGLKQPVIGSEYVPDAAKIAGAAFDGYQFSTDWFRADAPVNPWSKLFVDSYRKRYGKDPNYYAANFYEDTFAIWDLIRRVLTKGGDINSGEALQAELVAKPQFQSVYGGSASEVGTVTLDTKKHTVTSRPLSVLSHNGGNPKTLATYELGGADFKLAEGG
jgi:branched-chain amino acid transport system substrate-binding protein